MSLASAKVTFSVTAVVVGDHPGLRSAPARSRRERSTAAVHICVDHDSVEPTTTPYTLNVLGFGL